VKPSMDRDLARRSNNERGAAAVEFSLVVSMLASLVLGLIDTSFVMDDANRTRQLVRESVRMIATDSPTRVPNSSSTVCGATTGAMGNAARSQWAVCRVVALARGLRLDTTRLSVQVRTGQVTANGLQISPLTGAQHTEAIVVCVAYRTQSRSGLLGSLYDQRLLRSRMVIPADASTALTSSTIYQGSYGPTVAWTSCEQPTGTI
jgi:Flp pilus assembly protein TadG